MRILPELKKANGVSDEGSEVNTTEQAEGTTETVKAVITNRDVILYALGGECGQIGHLPSCDSRVSIM